MACTYYSFKGGLFGGDYWCDKKDCCVDTDTYRKYCRDYNYSNCLIYRNTESVGCFITTIVCAMLNKPDDDKVMTTLRKFRNEVLQKNEKYYDILKDYDNIGPIIASSIIKDTDCITMANTVYNNILIPITNLIENKEYDKAVSMYQIMTLSLIDCYGYREYYEEMKKKNYGYKIDEFNPEEAGHGKRKILKIQG